MIRVTFHKCRYANSVSVPVRFGSKAAATALTFGVRFHPKADTDQRLACARFGPGAASRVAKTLAARSLRATALVKAITPCGTTLGMALSLAPVPRAGKILVHREILSLRCSSHGLGELPHEFNEALDNRALCPVLQGHNGNWPRPDG